MNMLYLQANVASKSTFDYRWHYQQRLSSKRPLAQARSRSSHTVLASISAAAVSSSVNEFAASDHTGITAGPLITKIDISKVDEIFEVLKQYSAQATEAAGTALHQLLSPLQIFGESWYLNVMFFGVLGLLSYSLLILAPRQ